MSICFIADSGSDIPQGTKGVKVLPLTVQFADEIYQDGVTLSHHDFYEKLGASKELPITSQITPYAFEEAIREVLEAGDTPIVVTLSSKLSGTHQSAVIASHAFEEKVAVVDSLNASLGQRVLIEYGLRLAEEGKSAEEIVEELETKKKDIRLVALLDTLEFLKKGGRISSGVTFAGTLLSIKPVVCIKDGSIEMLGQARGSKQGNNFLAKSIEESGGVDFSMPYYIGYSGNETKLLERYIRDNEQFWKNETDNLPLMTVGGAVGTHTGPGVIAVTFFAKHK